MNHTVDDAIKKANAHLNNVDLPNYTALMDTLRYVLGQAELSDLGHSNYAVLRGKEVVAKYLKTVQS